MGEQHSRWVTMAASAVAVIAGLFSAGCGTWEEAEYPEYQYVAPAPPTAEELAAQQRARQQAAAENREILIGADDGDEYSDTDPSALTQWKPVLEDHGTWVDDPTYGTVWVPSSDEVGSDFQPYVTAGHWTYSDTTDYVWVSDYSWGWVPFHYGRWVYLPGHGWSWIPGRRYAGAWVTWRVGPAGYGYVGWAPMAPSWYWYRGVAVGWSFGFYRPYDYYVYCPHDHFYHGTVSTYVVRGSGARQHHERTRDYIPASPSARGGDRVVASPTVGGGDRVIARPSVGDRRVVASPTVAKGPKPDELGMNKTVVVAPPASDQGISRAQAYAVPRTAVAAGATPPAHWRPSAPTTTAPSTALGRAPATATFVPREAHPPPRQAAPQYRPTPRDAIASSPAYRAQPRSSTLPPYPSVSRPAPSFRSSPAIVGPRSSPNVSTSRSPSHRASTPSSRSSPSVSTSPSFRSSPPPSFRSSSPSIRSTPSFRSSPSVRSTPSFRSSPSVRSTPSFRSSSPSVRSSPTVRSSPSVRSSRSSSPSVRSLGSIRRR